jgi:hypothetical protein
MLKMPSTCVTRVGPMSEVQSLPFALLPVTRRQWHANQGKQWLDVDGLDCTGLSLSFCVAKMLAPIASTKAGHSRHSYPKKSVYCSYAGCTACHKSCTSQVPQPAPPPALPVLLLAVASGCGVAGYVALHVVQPCSNGAIRYCATKRAVSAGLTRHSAVRQRAL